MAPKHCSSTGTEGGKEGRRELKGEREVKGKTEGGRNSSQNFHYSVWYDNYSIVLLVVELLTMPNLLIKLYHRCACIGNNTQFTTFPWFLWVLE